MQNYKAVCGDNEEIWFEIEPNDTKRFFRWAKELGCVWLNGEKIQTRKIVDFFHFSINNQGRLGIVPISAWVSKEPKFRHIKRYYSFVSGNKS